MGFTHEINYRETDNNFEVAKPPSFKEQVLELIQGLFKELKNDKL